MDAKKSAEKTPKKAHEMIAEFASRQKGAILIVGAVFLSTIALTQVVVPHASSRQAQSKLLDRMAECSRVDDQASHFQKEIQDLKSENERLLGANLTLKKQMGDKGSSQSKTSKKSKRVAALDR